MDHYLNQLFIQILNMGITSAYCIAAVLAVRLLLWKAPRKYLYVLWLVVAFRLVCPVSVSTEFSLFNLDRFSQSAPASGNGSMEYIPEQFGQMEEPEVHTGVKAADTLINTQLPRAAAAASERSSLKNLLYVNGHYREPVAVFLFFGKYVWVFGMLVFLLYMAVSLRRMGRKVRMAVKAEEGEGIYECDGLASPFTMGFFRPRIYLPWGLQGKQREMILLHERYHICRKDHLVKLFSFCLLAVYWFHPLVWAAWICMCRDMEMSCDEHVLEILGEGQKKEYCQTLLAFAVDRRSVSRMPLAFGEHDVKSRIRHNLGFRKPALWVGVLAALVIGAVLIVFGTNGVQREDPDGNPDAAVAGSQAEETDEALSGVSEAARLLYKARNPYIGDAPADGRLLGAIAAARPDSVFAGLSYKMELQTSEEPYEFHFLLEENGESLKVDETDAPKLDGDMQITAVLMLALIDNLGEVQWFYTMETPEGIVNDAVYYCDMQWAEAWCGVSDIKNYGESPESVQELLDLLEERERDGEAAADDSGVFARWYADLPYELYEQAVPYEETEGSYTAYYNRNEDFLVELARTPDQVVTVYGCYSRQYGARGLTIDYQIVPGGDSNHNFVDVFWDADDPCCQIAMEDYDQDGREEIALSLLSGTGTGVHTERLILFETYDTGTLEPYEFTYDQIRAVMDRLLTASVDTENDRIQILDLTTPESSVPVLSIPYEDREGQEEVQGVDFLSWFHFRMDDGLLLQTDPGIRMDNWPGLRYLPREDGSDFVLTLRVLYGGSDPSGIGYFSLSLL